MANALAARSSFNSWSIWGREYLTSAMPEDTGGGASDFGAGFIGRGYSSVSKQAPMVSVSDLAISSFEVSLRI